MVSGLKKHIISLIEAIILAFILVLILGVLWPMEKLGIILWLFASVICYIRDKAKITLDDVIFDVNIANGIIKKLLVIFVWIVLGIFALICYPVLTIIELMEKVEKHITRE